MKAITVRQPWALHIIQSGKDIENRTRNIAGSYRGPLAIHAGLRADEDALRALPGRPPNGIPRVFHYGAFIGVADLIDVHGSGTCARSDPDRENGYIPCSPWAQYRFERGEWHQPQLRHLVLANPRPLTRPIPYRGRLGCWTVPDDVATQITEGLSQ